jgi:hypothetical protein
LFGIVHMNAPSIISDVEGLCELMETICIKIWNRPMKRREVMYTLFLKEAQIGVLKPLNGANSHTSKWGISPGIAGIQKGLLTMSREL